MKHLQVSCKVFTNLWAQETTTLQTSAFASRFVSIPEINLGCQVLMGIDGLSVRIGTKVDIVLSCLALLLRWDVVARNVAPKHPRTKIELLQAFNQKKARNSRFQRCWSQQVPPPASKCGLGAQQLFGLLLLAFVWNLRASERESEPNNGTSHT